MEGSSLDIPILIRQDAQNPIIIPPAEDKAVNFRLHGKKIAMTFPQCDVTTENMLGRIKNHFHEDGIKWVVVSRETHEDGNNHLHVGLWLKHVYDSRSARCFDFLAEKHGDYKIMTDPAGWVQYIIKDGNFKTFGINPQLYIKSRKKRKAVSFLEMALLMDEGSTVRECKKKHPGFVLQHLAKMRTYEAYTASNVDPAQLAKWSLIPALELTGAQQLIALWLNKNLFKTRSFGTKQMMIIGPTGAGKTSLIMKLRQYCRIYFVPMNEDWYDLYNDTDYDLIVFDEYKSQKTVQFMNQFVEGSPCQFKIKGSQGLKKKNLPVIILSNYHPCDMYPQVSQFKPEVLDTFKRRYDIIYLDKEKLFDINDELVL